MKNMIVLVAFLFGAGTALAQAPEQSKAPEQQAAAPKMTQVEKVAVGTGVESREIMGESTQFDVAAGRVFCWTRIVSQNVPTTVKHIWYADSEKAAEVPLTINYPTTRTWSSKAIWAGKWKVEVVSEAGEVLTSADFTVTAQPASAAPSPAAP